MVKLKNEISPIIGKTGINIKGSISDNKKIIGIKCLRLKEEIFNNVAIGISSPKNFEPFSPEKPAPSKKTIFAKAVMINKIMAKVVIQSLFSENLFVVIVF